MSTSTPISLSTTTTATGSFNFVNPPLGTYSVKVNPVAALVNTKPSIGNLTSAAGETVTNSNAPVVSKPANAGLSATSISVNQFLTTTTNLNHPFGPIGTGVAIVNHAPTASKAIPAVTLSATTTTSSVDLAGFFTDADMANSSITLNITNGTCRRRRRGDQHHQSDHHDNTTSDNLIVGGHGCTMLPGVGSATGVKSALFTVVSTPTKTSFTITDATAPGVYTSGGTVTPRAGITAVTNTIDPTITTSVADGLKVGDVVTISGVVGATGVNGTFNVATTPTATTFTVVTNAAPGVYTPPAVASVPIRWSR